MKKCFILFLLFSLLGFQFTSAQSDSTEISSVKVIDIIKLKDGRTLKGEILVFEEKDGDIVFKTLDGKTFSISRDEYEYFQEDQILEEKKKKVKKERIVRERKDGELQFSVGFSTLIADLDYDFDNSESLDQIGNFTDVNSMSMDNFNSINVRAGKFINQNNYIGLTGEVGFILGSKNYWDFGVQYAHHYGIKNSNFDLYVPIGLSYSQLSSTPQFGVHDSAWVNTWVDYEIVPVYSRKDSEIGIETNFSSINFSIGHGFAYVLPDKRSLAFEILLLNGMVMEPNYINREGNKPKFNEITSSGVKLSLMYNF